MTHDIDALIADTLKAEDRALLDRAGAEPGYFRQLGEAFTGPTGWPTMVLVVAQTVMFIAGVWAAWQFFQATEPLQALRWGLPSAVLILGSLVVKLSIWPAIHANRTIHALRRLELQLALRRQD
ncbi:DUF6768 family protein [Brevundimonas sp.]|uniref:DUF6768 family protein n=1 Tax=Brevundimonas sp. TaxID=1871086 RepID=UPI003AF5E2B7